jgi:hypothetical protein
MNKLDEIVGGGIRDPVKQGFRLVRRIHIGLNNADKVILTGNM